jgi:hypothetical protein
MNTTKTPSAAPTLLPASPATAAQALAEVEGALASLVERRDALEVRRAELTEQLEGARHALGQAYAAPAGSGSEQATSIHRRITELQEQITGITSGEEILRAQVQSAEQRRNDARRAVAEEAEAAASDRRRALLEKAHDLVTEFGATRLASLVAELEEVGCSLEGRASEAHWAKHPDLRELVKGVTQYSRGESEGQRRRAEHARIVEAQREHHAEVAHQVAARNREIAAQAEELLRTDPELRELEQRQGRDATWPIAVSRASHLVAT